MYSYWLREWQAVAVIVITGLLYNGAMGLGPILQGRVIDLIVAGEPRAQILRAIGIFLGVIAVVQFSRYLKRYYVRIFANRTNAAMRKEMYGRIMERTPEEMKAAGNTAGDLLTRGISDVSECVEGMRKFTTEVFDTGVLMVAYFIMLINYDLKITLAALIFIPVAMFTAERMKKIIYGYTKSYRSQLSRVSGLTLENVENELLYRMNGVEEIKAKSYDVQLEDLRQKAVRANMLENSMQPVYRVIGMLGVVIIVFMGGQKVLAGGWTIGTFSAYVSIFAAFSTKGSKASKLFNSVQKARVSWQRIKPFLKNLPQEQSLHNLLLLMMKRRFLW